MRCTRCGIELEQGESYEMDGKILCEDCCMYKTNPPKVCDPLAVASATSIRKELGQSGTAGLSERQERIYNLIVKKGQLTKEELSNILDIKPEDLESEFAILRHCELIRAFKQDGKIYLTIW